MRDISELTSAFEKYAEKLKKNLVEAQVHATDYMFEEVKDRIQIPSEARNITQFIRYESSLRVSEPKQDDSGIKTSVYSELLVGGDDPKWEFVPVGAFLEWGTGPLGESTNDYPHGYEYTTRAPWDEHTAIQWSEMGTWGIAARPHLYPALIATRPIFESNVKEAIEEAWKK